MNAKILLAGLVTTLAAAGAFANDDFNGEAHYQQPQASTSTVSRAQVKAELAQAQSSGLVAYGDAGYKVPDAVSTKTRAEVKAELAQAQASGEIAYGDAGYKTNHAVSTKSRAEVRAEAIKSQTKEKLANGHIL
jgi:Domain of unknown function (DUF4148)